MIATVCGELEYDAACAMRDTAAIGNCHRTGSVLWPIYCFAPLAIREPCRGYRRAHVVILSYHNPRGDRYVINILRLLGARATRLSYT